MSAKLYTAGSSILELTASTEIWYTLRTKSQKIPIKPYQDLENNELL